MATTSIALYFAVALLYVMGGYAFYLMVNALACIEDEVPTKLSPPMVRFLTVFWILVMFAVIFRNKKTA